MFINWDRKWTSDTTLVPSARAAGAALFEIFPSTALGRPAVGLTTALRLSIASVFSRFLAGFNRFDVCHHIITPANYHQHKNIYCAYKLIFKHHIHIRWPLCTGYNITTAACALSVTALHTNAINAVQLIICECQLYSIEPN